MHTYVINITASSSSKVGHLFVAKTSIEKKENVEAKVETGSVQFINAGCSSTFALITIANRSVPLVIQS